MYLKKIVLLVEQATCVSCDMRAILINPHRGHMVL
jgi:hypothetical protein